MRERSWESDRVHSVTQPLHVTQQALLNRSYDVDRPPPGVQGLDRAWELERARGMEMLHRSVEEDRRLGRGRGNSVARVDAAGTASSGSLGAGASSHAVDTGSVFQGDAKQSIGANKSRNKKIILR